MIFRVDDIKWSHISFDLENRVFRSDFMLQFFQLNTILGTIIMT